LPHEPGLKVVAPGLFTTVQDLGRFGYQNIGVPVSGALDGLSLRLANALVGNTHGTAALEILVSGPTLEVAADNVRVALVGYGATIAICSDPPRVVAAGQSITLSRGNVFRLIVARHPICCYLAVEGGVAVPPVLGSASTYARASLGGLCGRALQCEDVVPLAISRASAQAELRLPAPPDAARNQPIRVTLGPQHKLFTDQAVAELLEAEFRVSKSADRMGLRLEGPLLQHRDGWDIVSDAIPTGAIQVPGSGEPILLLADHQTTGGYPKIATVISSDLPVAGRRGPGAALRFTAVSVEEAEELCRDDHRRLSELIAAIEPVADRDRLDLTSLYDDNLISGVVTGLELTCLE
jgi:biotin-dependent carboxylase-like uncharacterized protein